MGAISGIDAGDALTMSPRLPPCTTGGPVVGIRHPACFPFGSVYGSQIMFDRGWVVIIAAGLFCCDNNMPPPVAEVGDIDPVPWGP